MKLKGLLRVFIAIMVMVFAVAADAVADIPPPKTEPAGVDWSFVLMGAIFSFLSALVFLWIGRKLFKKT